MQKQVYIETLGCEKNRVDSEIMLGALNKEGFQFTSDPESAHVIVLNTCAFLTSASQESIDRIIELSDLKSSAECEKLVAAGCLTQRYQKTLLEEIPELDGLLGSSDFEQIPYLITQAYENPQHPQVRINKKAHYAQYDQQARIQSTPAHFSYLKVAEGCSNRCTFCNIPQLRGNFSSRSVESITQEFKGLLEHDVREINIISQDTSSYGFDLKNETNLATLLKSVTELEGDFWVRLFYAYPNSFSEECLQIMADDPRFCRYLDMPFQHINNEVLRKMHRRITNQKIREKMDQIRHFLPNIALRSTFIVGFPTETDESFEELYNFVAEGHFQHLGVFLYSHEDNIVSARWGDPVPAELKRERKERLMELQQSISLRKNEELIGKRLKVLVDGVSDESELLLQGRSEFQGPEVDGLVYINEGEAHPKQFNTVEITDVHPYDLVGRVVEETE